MPQTFFWTSLFGIPQLAFGDQVGNNLTRTITHTPFFTNVAASIIIDPLRVTYGLTMAVFTIVNASGTLLTRTPVALTLTDCVQQGGEYFAESDAMVLSLMYFVVSGPNPVIASSADYTHGGPTDVVVNYQLTVTVDSF